VSDTTPSTDAQFDDWFRGNTRGRSFTTTGNEAEDLQRLIAAGNPEPVEGETPEVTP
jgi:hypothetical protein